MNLPNNLKDLQKLCEDKSLKFKGKTKAQLKDMLAVEIVVVDEDSSKEDFSRLNVKTLKAKCEELGLSKYGTKSELVKRLENKNTEGLKVVQWKKRARNVPTRPSETVEDTDDSTDDEEDVTSTYCNLKNHELRALCLSRNLPGSGSKKVLLKRLEESDALKKQVENETRCPQKSCESCEENPSTLYEPPHAKWFCKDCDQHICDMCKNAHSKIKIVRTHMILPFGTLLEFNIDRNVTLNEHDPVKNASVMEVETHFLDITLSDVEDEPVLPVSSKRKLVEEEETDLEDSFEMVYETPMAKIGYRRNKRIHLEVVSGVTIVPESPELTPPPVWYTPTPRRRTIPDRVSPIVDTPLATFVPESPENLDFSRDMFSESPVFVPETPLPPCPPPMPTNRAATFVETVSITPARLQRQRWRNWALTRLAHLPPNEVYSDQEVIDNLREVNATDAHDIVSVESQENVSIEVVVDTVEPPANEEEDDVPKKKTVTAKATKEKRRKLAYEVPVNEKSKCTTGKWSYNCQGGEIFCIDGYSYLINNHCISKKTGFLTLYLICSKCGGRNILVNGLLKKVDHPGHSCSPDPDNWELLQAEIQLKNLGEIF